MSADTTPTLDDVLAQAGFSISYRAPRMTIGNDVLKSLASGKVRVFVFSATGGDVLAAATAKINGVDTFTTDVDMSKVRAHVVNTAKSRKSALVVNGAVKDADGTVVGYSFSRPQ